jgi:hypothetical protein
MRGRKCALFKRGMVIVGEGRRSRTLTRRTHAVAAGACKDALAEVEQSVTTYGCA